MALSQRYSDPYINIPFPWPKSDLQGDPNRNFLFQIAVSLKRSIFDPSLVKPKCVLGVADFFSVFSCLFTIFKIMRHSWNTFWSLQLIVRKHNYGATAIWNCNFWFGSPCTIFLSNKLWHHFVTLRMPHMKNLINSKKCTSYLTLVWHCHNWY